jgi:hypothetical protein
MLKIANKFGGHGALTDFEVSLMYEFSVWHSNPGKPPGNFSKGHFFENFLLKEIPFLEG